MTSTRFANLPGSLSGRTDLPPCGSLTKQETWSARPKNKQSVMRCEWRSEKGFLLAVMLPSLSFLSVAANAGCIEYRNGV